MSKAGQRRTKKLVDYFCALLARDTSRFQSEWQKRLTSWAGEVHARARKMHLDRCDEQGNVLETSIYEIFEHAVDLLDACGPRAEALVGAQTRTFLDDVCAKAFASVACPEQGKLTNMYSKYLIARRRRRKPNRSSEGK